MKKSSFIQALGTLLSVIGIAVMAFTQLKALPLALVAVGTVITAINFFASRKD